jgi:hypothetical protein
MGNNGYQVPVPANALSGTLKTTGQIAGKPANEQHNISYGVVSEVDDATAQVKIKLYEGHAKDGTPNLGPELPQYFPLLNPLLDIVHRFGMLRTQMSVRVHWRGGQVRPDWAIVEIIGDEKYNTFTKDPQSNMLSTGPYKILSGGQLI